MHWHLVQPNLQCACGLVSPVKGRCGGVRVASVAGVKLLLSLPPDQSLRRCQVDRNGGLRKGGAALGLEVCQCVARNANMSWNPLNVDTGGFADGGEVRPN